MTHTLCLGETLTLINGVRDDDVEATVHVGGLAVHLPPGDHRSRVLVHSHPAGRVVDQLVPGRRRHTQSLKAPSHGRQHFHHKSRGEA